MAEDLRREKERREEGEENKVSYIDHIGEDIETLEAKKTRNLKFSSYFKKLWLSFNYIQTAIHSFLLIGFV